MRKPKARTLDMTVVRLLDNYRKKFNQFRLQRLAESIRDAGLIKPIIVTPDGAEFGVVAGQRRYLAHQIIEADTIDCMVYSNLTSEQILEIQQAENSQEKIAPDELAISHWELYKARLAQEIDFPMESIDECVDYWDINPELTKDYGLTKFAREIGKQHGVVIRSFRFQRLNARLQEMVAYDKIPFSKAVEVARIPNKNEQMRFSKYIIDGKIAEDGKDYSVVSAKKLGKIIDTYLRDREMKNSGTFELSTSQATPKKKKKPSRSIKPLNDAAAFFRVYCELQREMPWLSREVYGNCRVDKVVASIDAGLSALEAVLEESSKYELAVKTPREISLKDRVLNGDVLKVGSESKDIVPKRKEKLKVSYLALDIVHEDEHNPRRRYGQQNLEDLAESVRAIGVIQPILVVPVKTGGKKSYRVVTGHRRRKASIAAGLVKIPAIVRTDLSEADCRILQHEEDLFEEVGLADRAESIYNRKVLLEAKEGRSLSVAEFARMMPGFGLEEIRNALKFHELDDRIKVLQCNGMLQYSVAVKLGGIAEGEGRYMWAARAVLGKWNAAKYDKVVKNAMEDDKSYPVEHYTGAARAMLAIANNESAGMGLRLRMDVESHLQNYASTITHLVKTKLEDRIEELALVKACVESEKAFEYFRTASQTTS